MCQLVCLTSTSIAFSLDICTNVTVSDYIVVTIGGENSKQEVNNLVSSTSMQIFFNRRETFYRM